MAFEPVHMRATELLLSAMFQNSETGLPASFMFSRPGYPLGIGGGGTTLYFQRKELVRAILYVRQNGPTYLRYVSVNDIWSMLTRFVTDNYGYLAPETFGTRFTGSYADFISDSTKGSFAEALAASSIFRPTEEINFFPLIPVEIGQDFRSDPFLLAAATSTLSLFGMPDQSQSGLNFDRFPPLPSREGVQYFPRSWLGVRSPSPLAASKIKAAVLGALALTQQNRVRYLFSDRGDLFGGRCTVGDRLTVSMGEPHTPPLMHNIRISNDDHVWLNLLAQKLATDSRAVRRELAALEYFYRSWDKTPSERFPLLCMSLDAAFGETSHATKSVIDGVRETLGVNVREDRLRLLMSLRAALIHGGAPDVYDSRKYGRYYDQFDADPIRDLELVVARCLMRVVFGETMVEHPHPNQAILDEARLAGRLPTRLEEPSILFDRP